MKIIHASGEQYDLAPDTSLEIERTNPFFNEYGEQSLPVTLPSSPQNRRLMVYPDDIAQVAKASQRIDAKIMHGLYAVPARQAILSAKYKEGIECSFYLNTGAFYEKISDVPLSDVFAEKRLVFGSVAEAIAFCRNLFINHDDRFACFPVKTESGYLNRLTSSGTSDGYPTFYNAVKQTEIVDDKTIALDPGYYITPFIRVNHVLDIVFQHFGYTMSENFFTRTSPFSDMVFLNNNIDTLMKASIEYSQIVPDITVKALLDIFRNKFNCEFIPDEVNKTIDIVLFNEILDDGPVCDLSRQVVGDYTVTHPEFRQLKLSCEHLDPYEAGAVNAVSPGRGNYNIATTASDETVDENFETLTELLKRYPEACYDPDIGEFYRTGYKGHQAIRQRLGFITMDYYAGGVLEAEDKQSSDVSICMFKSGTPRQGYTVCPYVGATRALNSTIVLDSVNTVDEESSTEEKQDETADDSLSAIFCFVARSADGKSDMGTILDRDVDRPLWDYSLAYHGPNGLFERFWRRYDNMLRNSFLQVQADILLTEAQKYSLPAHRKVVIDGQELLVDNFSYVLDEEITTSAQFLTTRLYTPVSEAIKETDRMPAHLYAWELHYSKSADYLVWAYVEEPVTMFYAPPTEEEYNAGGRYHQSEFSVEFYNRTYEPSVRPPGVPGTLTVWLEPVLAS